MSARAIIRVKNLPDVAVKTRTLPHSEDRVDVDYMPKEERETRRVYLNGRRERLEDEEE